MGREDEHAPFKPSLRCAAQALLWWGRVRAWQAEATVSREACAGAGGVCALERRSGRNRREVTSSCDRIECRNASVHARSARRSRRHELARASSRSKKLCSFEQLERSLVGMGETEMLSTVRLEYAPSKPSAISTCIEKEKLGRDSTTPGALQNPQSPRRVPMAQSGLLARMSQTGQYTATSCA